MTVIVFVIEAVGGYASRLKRHNKCTFKHHNQVLLYCTGPTDREDTMVATG